MLDPDDLDCLTTQGNIANEYGRLGNFSEAKKHQETVLEQRRRLLGQQHSTTLCSMNNLAIVLFERGQHEQALKIHQSVLDARTKGLGQAHMHTLASLDNLATVLRCLGRHPDAFAKHQEALQERIELLGDTHPEMLASLNNVALGKARRGLVKEAAACLERVSLERVMQARTDQPGLQHPLTLTAASNLASIRAKLERERGPARALQNHLHLARVFQALLGPEHPHILCSRSNVACSCSNVACSSEGAGLEEHQAAHDEHGQVLQDQSRILGPDHAETLTSTSNWALELLHMDWAAEAVPVFCELLSCWGTRVGLDHPDTLRCLGHLGHALAAAHQYAEAASCFAKLRGMCERNCMMGHYHPHVLVCMDLQANAHVRWARRGIEGG